ncbi:MAG: hypothetical protein M3010_08470, partial [Candidatus Dormibacteraeota bacterium]|nr:hypothetical protein [Candidatus Dormibacteraeota bacterium]
QTGEARIGLRVAAALWMFWYTRGYATEGRSHLSSLLALPAAARQSPERGRALLAAGQLARAQGDYPAAAAAMSESVAIYRRVDDPGGLAGALLGSAFVARMKEQHAVAMGLLREGLPLARCAGDQHVVAATLHHLGMIEAETGADADIVRGHLEEGLELYRGTESPRFVGLILATLASVELSADNLDRARELSRQSLEALGAGGDTLEIHWALDEISHLLHREEKPEAAVRLAGAAAAMREAIGVTTSPVSTRRRAQMLEEAGQALGDTGFEAGWSQGRAMSHAEALEAGAASVSGADVRGGSTEPRRHRGSHVDQDVDI